MSRLLPGAPGQTPGLFTGPRPGRRRRRRAGPRRPPSARVSRLPGAAAGGQVPGLPRRRRRRRRPGSATVAAGAQPGPRATDPALAAAGGSPRRNERVSRPLAHSSRTVLGAARNHPVRAPGRAPGCPRVAWWAGEGWGHWGHSSSATPTTPTVRLESLEPVPERGGGRGKSWVKLSILVGEGSRKEDESGGRSVHALLVFPSPFWGSRCADLE